MKIIVLNSADVNIEVLNIPDRMIENDDIEQFLPVTVIDEGYLIKEF